MEVLQYVPMRYNYLSNSTCLIDIEVGSPFGSHLE